jgi:hypothetical protein
MTEPKLPVSRRQTQLAKARAKRAERALRRKEMLEDVVGGVDRAEIARTYGVSLKTVAREVARALDQRRLDTPDRFLRLQVERLTRALQSIDRAIEAGEIDAVAHLIKVMDKLDRYHGLAYMAAAAEPPAAPLALPREGTQNTSQAPEVA